MPEFLTLGIQSPAFIDRVTANSIGIAYPAIAESRLSSFHLAFPADKKEQEKIVEYVHKKVKPFDKAIKSVDREVGLLREYKTRLVADVVTGKLDVRPAAEKLPLVEEEIQEESEDFLEETADAE
jgi:type I restriction enzyme S subunit